MHCSMVQKWALLGRPRALFSVAKNCQLTLGVGQIKYTPREPNWLENINMWFGLITRGFSSQRVQC